MVVQKSMTPTQPNLRPVPRSVMAPEEQRARAIELEALLEDRLAARAESFPCGTALFNDAHPRAGSLNVLRVESGTPPLDADALMQFADELQAGLPQRSLRVVDDERADQLRPGFAAAGWVVGSLTLMAPRRLPDRPIDVTAIAQVELDELLQAREGTMRNQHRDLDTAEQLLAAGGLPADGVELRCFAARIGTEVAAYAVARVTGEVAKITELDAFARAHGSGLGRAVVWGAVSALRREGARLVVVEAEDDTWPKWTFRRLGFEDIGNTHRFVRPWGDESVSAPAI
jgi:predicted N-acetyltransferase YhbS